jgi:hypothetical protein
LGGGNNRFSPTNSQTQNIETESKFNTNDNLIQYVGDDLNSVELSE